MAYQRDHVDIDIFTGYPFPKDMAEKLTIEAIENLIVGVGGSQGEQPQGFVTMMRNQGMTDEEIAITFSKQMAQRTSNATFDGSLSSLGVANVEKPFVINIYPIDFDAKAKIDTILKDYNKRMENDGNDDLVIHYADIVGTMMSSVTRIVNFITYILIAFVAVSLIVSSIMIGILRSIGASKKD